MTAEAVVLAVGFETWLVVVLSAVLAGGSGLLLIMVPLLVGKEVIVLTLLVF